MPSSDLREGMDPAAPLQHSVLPLGVQMQLRRAAINGDLAAIDTITDAMAKLGLVRRRTECQWMTRAEIISSLQGPL
jgi:hypothetical protein